MCRVSAACLERLRVLPVALASATDGAVSPFVLAFVA